MREIFKGVITPIAQFFLRIGFRPNTVTLIGLAGHFAAAYLVSTGRIAWAGLFLLLIAPLDALDGAMARLLGKPSSFGGFLDSVTDRYSEFVLFGGLLVYYHQQESLTGIILAYFSIMGSIMVSYTRAKAESLGFNAKIGLLSRVERYVVLLPALIFNIPMVALWILAIFTNFTSLQRILYIRQQSRVRGNPSSPS